MDKKAFERVMAAGNSYDAEHPTGPGLMPGNVKIDDAEEKRDRALDIDVLLTKLSFAQKTTEVFIHQDAIKKLVSDLTARAEKAESRIVELEAENAELRERTRWIPVSEGLPEFYRLVLVVCRDEEYITACSRSICGEPVRRHFPFLDVTHWMPLPEPPESEG